MRFWLLVSCLLARRENGVEGRGEGETDAGDIKKQGLMGSHMMLTSLSFPKIGKKEKKIKSDVSLLFRRVAVTPPLPKGLSFLKKERFFERLGKCGKVGHLTKR